MDVNGTKFHLVYGKDDWGNHRLVGQDKTLSESWLAREEIDLQWDNREQGLQLAQQAPLFRRARERDRVPVENRRGGARDAYGNWYWINQQRNGIRFLGADERTSLSFWQSADSVALCENELLDDFTVCSPDPVPEIILQGLAVTSKHYLIVGNVTERGLFIFDLHRGSPPVLMQWPGTVDFEPWDLVALANGGLLILDRTHKKYWYLDENLRLLSTITTIPADFQPDDAGDETPNRIQQKVTPQGFELGAEVTDAISIAPAPDGHVLILDTPADTELASSIHEYDGETLITSYSLDKVIQAVDRNDPTGESILYSVRANDIAYQQCNVGEPCTDFSNPPTGDGETVHMLYVVEERGNQAIAFEMARDVMKLEPMADYLPMRRWGEKALVRAGDGIYYDFEDRWIRLQVFDDCYYSKRATFTTPIDFVQNLPEQPFDSNIPGCTWHRFLLDAHIPVGAYVTVRARAADDPSLLPQSPWITQPRPYERAMGADLPYYEPNVTHRRHIENRMQAVQVACVTDEQLDDAQPDTITTWEFLFQQVRGRYIQLEITLEGTSRSTPTLFAMRVWYPRFSYSEHYLPAIYREEANAANFVERWLANFEGFYTYFEDAIEQVYLLFDPYTAPPDTLDWLASWMGLILDPLWSEKRRRFFIKHLYKLYQMRGTVAGLEVAIRMYTDHEKDLTPALFEPESRGKSRVRIIEDFLTRNGIRLQYGDTYSPDEVDSPADANQRIQLAAHRFTVLLPHDLSPEGVLMAERIIELEKPAHTAYELKRYWDMFRVGEARLGIDTQIGESHYFVPYELGSTYLPDGYLAFRYPFNVRHRFVMGRDRVDESNNVTT